MKKFILSLLVILGVQLQALSQTSYPRYEKDSLGQTVVVMTVEQAQALDNSTDLLTLFRKLDAQIIDYDSVCVRVIGQKEQVIAQQTVQINKLKETLNVKADEIANLQQQIAAKDMIIINLNQEIGNKNSEIDLHLGEVRRLKRNMWLGGGLSGAAIVGLLLTIIAIK